MDSDMAPRRRAGCLGLTVLALVIGCLIVAGEGLLTGTLAYALSNLSYEWLPLVLRTLLVSLPFLLLALRRVTARLPWVAGLLLSLLLWGYVVFQQRSGSFENSSSAGSALWVMMTALGGTAGITLVCALLSRRSRPAA